MQGSSSGDNDIERSDFGLLYEYRADVLRSSRAVADSSDAQDRLRTRSARSRRVGDLCGAYSLCRTARCVLAVARSCGHSGIRRARGHGMRLYSDSRLLRRAFDKIEPWARRRGGDRVLDTAAGRDNDSRADVAAEKGYLRGGARLPRQGLYVCRADCGLPRRERRFCRRRRDRAVRRS